MRAIRHYYWPTLARGVKEYVKTCTVCQRTRVHRHRPYHALDKAGVASLGSFSTEVVRGGEGFASMKVIVRSAWPVEPENQGSEHQYVVLRIKLLYQIPTSSHASRNKNLTPPKND